MIAAVIEPARTGASRLEGGHPSERQGARGVSPQPFRMRGGRGDF